MEIIWPTNLVLLLMVIYFFPIFEILNITFKPDPDPDLNKICGSAIIEIIKFKL